MPLDENITAREARIWLEAHVYDNEEIVRTGVIDVMDREDWDAAFKFVWSCLKRGVTPHEYVNLLINYQQVLNAFCR